MTWGSVRAARIPGTVICRPALMSALAGAIAAYAPRDAPATATIPVCGIRSGKGPDRQESREEPTLLRRQPAARLLATDQIEIIGQGDPADSGPCATDEGGIGGFDGERFAPVCIPAKFATDATGNAAIVLADISRADASILPVEPDPVTGGCQRGAGSTIEAAQAQPHDLPDYGGG